MCGVIKAQKQSSILVNEQTLRKRLQTATVDRILPAVGRVDTVGVRTIVAVLSSSDQVSGEGFRQYPS